MSLELTNNATAEEHPQSIAELSRDFNMNLQESQLALQTLRDALRLQGLDEDTSPHVLALMRKIKFYTWLVGLATQTEASCGEPRYSSNSPVLNNSNCGKQGTGTCARTLARYLHRCSATATIPGNVVDSGSFRKGDLTRPLGPSPLG